MKTRNNNNFTRNNETTTETRVFEISIYSVHVDHYIFSDTSTWAMPKANQLENVQQAVKHLKTLQDVWGTRIMMWYLYQPRNPYGFLVSKWLGSSISCQRSIDLKSIN